MKTFLEILSAAAGVPVDVIEQFFADVKEKAPDLAPVVDKFLADLGSGVNPEAVAAVVKVLPAEVLDILRGILKPEDHASDGI
jgi:hypothetical protein